MKRVFFIIIGVLMICGCFSQNPITGNESQYSDEAEYLDETEYSLKKLDLKKLDLKKQNLWKKEHLRSSTHGVSAQTGKK